MNQLLADNINVVVGVALAIAALEVRLGSSSTKHITSQRSLTGSPPLCLSIPSSSRDEHWAITETTVDPDSALANGHMLLIHVRLRQCLIFVSYRYVPWRSPWSFSAASNRGAPSYTSHLFFVLFLFCCFTRHRWGFSGLIFFLNWNQHWCISNQRWSYYTLLGTKTLEFGAKIFENIVILSLSTTFLPCSFSPHG